MSITIRQETPDDIEQINDITESAFLKAAHASHTEQLIVKALRNADALTLSLVADDAGQVVGHVAVSEVTISGAALGWYGLGPISVDPKVQGKGIGAQLMHAALSGLKDLGAKGCVLLGDPNYYIRFGFKPIDGLVYPEAPSEYFQAISFDGEFAQGEVAYHEAFSVTA